MYTVTNYKTKKALKESLAHGDAIAVFSPGPFPCPTDGRIALEGPHYPEPHKWYASGIVQGGKLIKIT